MLTGCLDKHHKHHNEHDDGNSSLDHMNRHLLIKFQTTTSPSSTTTLNTASETAVAFNCPASNYQTVNENGASWIVGCAQLVSGTMSGNYPATNSWNDCFLYCDATTGCTGFTYSGGVNGVGAGTCYFRNAAQQGFVANDTMHVGAIRQANYQAIVTTVGFPSYTLSFQASSAGPKVTCTDRFCARPRRLHLRPRL